MVVAMCGARVETQSVFFVAFGIWYAVYKAALLKTLQRAVQRNSICIVRQLVSNFF